MRVTLILLSVLLLGLNARGQETLDRVLVVVDEEIILESEVSQELQRYAMESGIEPAELEGRLDELKFQLVEAMIDNKVLLAAARRDTTIVVDDRDVDRQVENRLDEIIRRVGTQRRLEEMMSQTMKEIRRDLRRDMRDRLYVEELQRRKIFGVDITRQEVESFYAAWQDSIPDVGESVRLAQVFLEYKVTEESERRARVRADSVRALLFAGENAEATDFAELARLFSQDPASAPGGGGIGRTKRGMLVRPYEEAAYRMAAEEISEPVRSDYGWHLIRLDGRTGEYIESSHILFKLEPTAEDMAVIDREADSLHALLQAGEDFAEAARRRTDHALSREAGGDLGWIELEQLRPLVRSRVRDLESGEFTRPIRGELEGKSGVQIFKLLDHRPARRPSLEEDWEQIRALALNHKKQLVMQEWVAELRADVYIRVVD